MKRNAQNSQYHQKTHHHHTTNQNIVPVSLPWRRWRPSTARVRNGHTGPVGGRRGTNACRQWCRLWSVARKQSTIPPNVFGRRRTSHVCCPTSWRRNPTRRRKKGPRSGRKIGTKCFWPDSIGLGANNIQTTKNKWRNSTSEVGQHRPW